jgi:hypothetical protein
VQVYRSERVGLDLDTVDDLRTYVSLARRIGAPVIEPLSSGELLATHDPQSAP